MSRLRASAIVASLVASLVLAAGVTALTTEAASAEPRDPNGQHNEYPPVPSRLTVNRGTVTAGSSVRLTGHGFGKRETVWLRVLYKPLFWDHYTTVLWDSAYTDKKGNFSVRVQMYLPGTAIIKARGARSGKKASAPVRIILFGHGPDGWLIIRAGYATNETAPASNAVAAPTPAIALAGLGVLALAGSAVITRQTVRRRRKVIGSA